MNQIDEAKKEEVDVECKRPSKTTKYTRNEVVKLVLLFIFITMITDKISFLEAHETLKVLVYSGVFILLSIRLLSRIYAYHHSELLELNQIDIRSFEVSKDKYLMLYKEGHVESFNVIKCLLGDIRKLLPICILWTFLFIIEDDYFISNIYFITIIMMPVISIWYGYKNWIDVGTLKLMGINRDNMKHVED